MTSKEALEQLEQYITNEKGRLSIFIKLYFEIIKQDLERLEALKKENKELKQILEKAEEVEQENLILKIDNEQLNHIANERLKKNEKLKKAIDILKDRLCVRNGTLSFTRDSYYLGIKGSFKDIKELTQQEYDLLKEVLGNEI